MSRSSLSIFLSGALALGCTPAPTAPSAGATEATLTLLRKAEPSVAELKSAVAAVVHAKAPGQVAAAPVVTVEDAAVLTLEKVREDVQSTSAVPKKGDTARIDYAFSYLEAQGTTEIAMDGTLSVGFAFDGANFNPVDRPKVEESHFGITDVMTGNVTDCDTGLPLYKAEVTVFFRDDRVKRLFTGQAGEYTIRAVKGEQVTVRASYPNYTAEDVYTYVPDQVDFTLCAAPQPPAPGPGTGSTEPPPAGLSATDLATGVFHTCAVTSDNEVRCWGKNDEGQLGNGTLVSSAMPVTVSSLADVAQVEAGDRHTCALTTAGAVKCWGKNNWGQLGNGTYTRSVTPVQVSGLTSGVRAIVTGENFTCAVKHADGSVVCWGLNNFGQVGDNSYNPTSGPAIPTQVVNANGTPLTGVDSIEAGGQYVCVTKAGAVTCWGYNDLAQLGLETATGPEVCQAAYGPIRYCSKTPVASKLTANVASVSLMQYSVCALLNDGAVKCWGDNRDGQLGTTAALDTCSIQSYGDIACSLALRSPGLTEAAAEVMTGTGNGFYCAVVGAAVQCWGGVSYAAMGAGAPVTGPTVMTKATAGLSRLSGGYYHVCGITPAGKPECWGRNVEGELGAGDTAAHDAPVRPRGF